MNGIVVNMKRKPILDPGFVPAALWNQAYRSRVQASGKARKLILALERADGTVSTFATEVFPHEGPEAALNVKYVERLLKHLLWMKGGYKVVVAGDKRLAAAIAAIYSPEGARAFDFDIMGRRIYGKTMVVESRDLADAPASREVAASIGGHLEGCRIGFDLGGSDRKAAAVVDGKVVFSEEIGWDPYFQKDPAWHKAGINDSLRRAAAHLPRVDAIGGSSAGVLVNNTIRLASLFRGVPEDAFEKQVKPLFLELRSEWDVPFEVANDGDVTALAGAMEVGDGALLGVSMGTSQAGGYVDRNNQITGWLNELAFAPVDYRDDAPADEWSGDLGCGVQYFSQQAVARLAPAAGIPFEPGVPFPERLSEVQRLMAAGDRRAAKIYDSIGVYFGYTIAHYAEHYDLRHLLILGRVTSGVGGDMILSVAEDVLKAEFPHLSGKIGFHTPDEQNKRHGQAVAAASLPARRS